MYMQFALDAIPNIVSSSINVVYKESEEQFLSLVNENLDLLYRREFKLKFLSDVIISIEKKKIEHESECNLPNCSKHKSFEKAVFIIQQEIDKLVDDINIYEDYSRFNLSLKGEQFSNEEIENINDKLDKIILGQEITYDDLQKEIEELKELIYVLNKKNFKELLTGKLINMTVDGFLSKKMLDEIFKSFGYNGVEKLLN